MRPRIAALASVHQVLERNVLSACAGDACRLEGRVRIYLNLMYFPLYFYHNPDAAFPALPSTFETEGITEAYVVESVRFLRDGKRPEKKDVIRLLKATTKQLSQLPSLIRARFGPEDEKDDGSLVRTEKAEESGVGNFADHFNVCGDTHGQFYDLLHIFDIAGYPSPTNPFLFNGDFVDRGSWSFEVVMTLFMFKLLHPENMHLTRGNHERCGFPSIPPVNVRGGMIHSLYYGFLFCQSLLPLLAWI
jgi:hypothetical protein